MTQSEKEEYKEIVSGAAMVFMTGIFATSGINKLANPEHEIDHITSIAFKAAKTYANRKAEHDKLIDDLEE